MVETDPGAELPGDDDAFSPLANECPAVTLDGDLWSVDAVELAYRQALEASEAAGLEWFEPSALTLSGDEAGHPELPPPIPAATPLASGIVEPTPEVAPASEQLASESTGVPQPLVSPEQVLEAMLFVGGPGLTSKRMASVLGGSQTAEDVQSMLDCLAVRYEVEQRPYQVRLHEGGYRLDLRYEHERIRARVYGLAPREVRLSQDLLDVLAVIAYHQPISKNALEDRLGRPPGPAVRKLLLRELIAVQKGAAGEESRYSTTARFLQVFGLKRIQDLPRMGDVVLR